MAKLIRPDNGQPGEFICIERGYICLRTSCITPAVRWFSEAAINKVNPVATCAEPPRALVLVDYDMPWEPYTAPLVEATPNMVITPTPDLAANVNHVICVSIKVVNPVTLWHESMAA